MIRHFSILALTMTACAADPPSTATATQSAICLTCGGDGDGSITEQQARSSAIAEATRDGLFVATGGGYTLVCSTIDEGATWQCVFGIGDLIATCEVTSVGSECHLVGSANP